MVDLHVNTNIKSDKAWWSQRTLGSVRMDLWDGLSNLNDGTDLIRYLSQEQEPEWTRPMIKRPHSWINTACVGRKEMLQWCRSKKKT